MAYTDINGEDRLVQKTFTNYLENIPEVAVKGKTDRKLIVDDRRGFFKSEAGQ